MSCLKQTLTLGLVTPTVTKTLEEANGAEEALAAEALAVVQAIAETVQLLKIKLTITEGTHWAIQYKKIVYALPVYCTDKGYQYIEDIICTNTEPLQATFLPLYPIASQWSSTYHVEIKTVNPLAIPDRNGARTPITQMVEKTHIFNLDL